MSTTVTKRVQKDYSERLLSAMYFRRMSCIWSVTSIQYGECQICITTTSNILKFDNNLLPCKRVILSNQSFSSLSSFICAWLGHAYILPPESFSLLLVVAPPLNVPRFSILLPLSRLICFQLRFTMAQPWCSTINSPNDSSTSTLISYNHYL